MTKEGSDMSYISADDRVITYAHDELRLYGTKLNPELKETWLDALRSGKYAKGMSQLHDSASNTYCCLGVLAEVCGREITFNGESTIDPETGKPESYKWFADTLGLGTVSPLYKVNDGGPHRKEDFTDVIDLIQECL